MVIVIANLLKIMLREDMMLINRYVMFMNFRQKVLMIQSPFTKKKLINLTRKQRLLKMKRRQNRFPMIHRAPLLWGYYIIDRTEKIIPNNDKNYSSSTSFTKSSGKIIFVSPAW